MGLKKRVAHVSSVERMYESLRQKRGVTSTSAIKKASACIFWRRHHSGVGIEVYLAQRAPTMKFLGGLWAFVGGGTKESESFEACCVREVYEEVGVRVDESRLVAASRWKTPDVSPIRFDARYFLVELKNDEEPDFKKSQGELVDGDFYKPQAALEMNRLGQMIFPSPVWRVLKALKGKESPCLIGIEEAAQDEAEEDTTWFITPDVSMAPLRTPTLPPATHTNTYFLGKKEIVIVDPGSPYEMENKKLVQGIERLGLEPKAILLTHHHGDHVGGANDIAKTFGVPIWASRETAELLEGVINVERELRDGDVLTVGNDEFKVIITPGHAKGHCCFLSKSSKFLVAGDMVAGVGTIYIDPVEGHMADYMASLRRLRSMNVHAIGPAHGSPIANVDEKIGAYLTHRMMRESMIIESIKMGPKTIKTIVESVYKNTPRFLWAFAGRQTQSHLIKLANEGKVKKISDTWQICQN